MHPAAEEEVTVTDECFEERSFQQSSPEWSKMEKTDTEWPRTEKKGGCYDLAGDDHDDSNADEHSTDDDDRSNGDKDEDEEGCSEADQSSQSDDDSGVDDGAAWLNMEQDEGGCCRMCANIKKPSADTTKPKKKCIVQKAVWARGPVALPGVLRPKACLQRKEACSAAARP